MLNEREPRTFDDEAAPPNYMPGIGRGATGFTTRSDIGPAQTPMIPLTTNTPGTVPNLTPKILHRFDKEDDEADAIWETIDNKMKNRRKKRKINPEVVVKKNVSDQFKDLKEKLKSVSYQEWDAIPEASTG